MKKGGYIKEYRRDLDDLKSLSDGDFRYYKVSLLMADWDKRHKTYGTFDARTKTMQEQLGWSVGKVSGVKTSLLKKGFYKRAQDRRLTVVNADLIFGKGKDIYNLIHSAEFNIHCDEYDFQRVEKQERELRTHINETALKLTMPWQRDSEE